MKYFISLFMYVDPIVFAESADNIVVKANKISDETKSVMVEDYVGDVQRKHRFKKGLR